MQRKGQIVGTIVALIIGVIMLVSVGIVIVGQTVTESTTLSNKFQQNATPSTGDTITLSYKPYATPTLYSANASALDISGMYTYTDSNYTYEFSTAGLDHCHTARNCLANFTHAGDAYITSSSARTIFTYLPLFLALGALVLVASLVTRG